MSKESRFVFKTLEIETDTVQEIQIAEFNQLTQQSKANINKSNRKLNQIETMLTSLENNVPTAEINQLALETRVDDAEYNLDGLTITAPAFGNINLNTKDHIDASSTTNRDYFYDLTRYLGAKSGDSFTYFYPNVSFIDPNKRYYVEITGEITADEDDAETEYNLDRSDIWVKVYEYRRTHVEQIQVGGSLNLSDVSNRESFQFTYGSGNIGGSDEGDDTDKVFFKTKRSYLSEPDEYVMLRGVQFRYITTFEARSSFKSSGGGQTYQHGYGIAFNRNSKNIDFRNIKMRIVRLN